MTIPAIAGTTIAFWLLSPILLVAALAIDIVRFVVSRSPFMAVRMVVFGLVYLSAEVVGIAAAGLVWMIGFPRSRMEHWTYRIQAAWASVLLRAVETIFGLQFSADGVECVAPGPVIVVSRHTSLVDNLLPARYVARPGNLRLRYVLKKELMRDPALDVVGNRLPNAFVDRESRASIAQVARLAEDLGPQDGILIFPEGTRFTPHKLRRAKRALERRTPRLAQLAAGYKSVLPPRTGGTLALLDAAASDVVVLAHRGLDGFGKLADIWRGAMVGKDVQVKLWRVEASSIPSGRDARSEWLFEVFGQIDDWINGGNEWAT